MADERRQWAVIVLAAGRSSRMGRAKQLVMVDGERMVVRALRVALASEAAHVVLVTGAYQDEVVAAVKEFVDLARERLQVVFNPDWEDGQAGSMKAGLNALPNSIGAAMIFPVDQPFMDPLLLHQLAAAWQAGAPMAAPIVDGEFRGAPALFDRSLWAELQQVQGDAGGRMLLRAHADHVEAIDAPAAWLRDVDTPEDLAAEAT